MSSTDPVFSHVVPGARVGRGPIMGPNGEPLSGSHRGVDLAVPSGSSVKPVADGVVVFSGYRSDYGNVVVIHHELPGGRQIYSLYAHLDQAPLVRKDDRVTTGTTLGPSGSTGRSTGPHVHFEIVQRAPGQPDPIAEVAPNYADLSGYFSYKLLGPKANPEGLLTCDPTRLERHELTPTERCSQLRLNDAELEAYKTRLATIESLAEMRCPLSTAVNSVDLLSDIGIPDSIRFKKRL